MNRTVLRWSTAGERRVRTAASASSVVSSSATGSWPGASKYGMPGRCCSTAAGQPRGVRVLMPRPLSSQTSSSGQSRRTCVRYAAALKAPAAVEWFTEASPKLAMTSASSGHGVSRPSTFASPRAKPSPTARGRCEAMVEVCGTMCSLGVAEHLVPAARDRVGRRSRSGCAASRGPGRRSRPGARGRRRTHPSGSAAARGRWSATAGRWRRSTRARPSRSCRSRPRVAGASEPRSRGAGSRPGPRRGPRAGPTRARSTGCGSSGVLKASTVRRKCSSMGSTEPEGGTRAVSDLAISPAPGAGEIAGVALPSTFSRARSPRRRLGTSSSCSRTSASSAWSNGGCSAGQELVVGRSGGHGFSQGVVVTGTPRRWASWNAAVRASRPRRGRRGARRPSRPRW